MRFGAFGEAAWVGERFRARGSCLRKWICAKAAKRVAERFLRGPAKSSCVDDLCALVARLPRRSEYGMRPETRRTSVLFSCIRKNTSYNSEVSIFHMLA